MGVATGANVHERHRGARLLSIHRYIRASCAIHHVSGVSAATAEAPAHATTVRMKRNVKFTRSRAPLFLGRLCCQNF